MTHRHTAAELVELVADPGSFTPWDADVVSTDPLRFEDSRPYGERLAEAKERSGVTEAIIAGAATIGGRAVVLVLGEFSFLGGTLGVATAERVVRAFERATDMRVPVVALPISGGTRMQEGVAGFIQMAACAAAVRRFRDQGLLYVVYLRNPTTGGVLGSWASLAHVRFAEPGALIGLTGPRVVRTLTGAPLGEGIQSAENLFDHGFVDEIVAPAALRSRLCDVLDRSDPRPSPWEASEVVDVPGTASSVDAWTAVEESRRPGRWTAADVLEACGAQLLRLRGDGAGAHDGNAIVALARVCGVGAVVLAQRREPGARGASIGAVGYRMFRRGMDLADELGLPLVTFVDTAGAAMSDEDEGGGLAAMIAACLAAMAGVRSPTVSVLVGEGSGGGAVALLPADRVVAAQHSWLAPIAPEGASAILYRTTERAAEVAAAQAIGATELQRLGLVDVVVPDSDDGAPQRLAAVLGGVLRGLAAEDVSVRLQARRDRYRAIAR